MKKTTKFLRRLAALLLAVLLAAGTVSALAEDALMGSKKASPTELTPDNRDTTVTLSLPSEEYKNKVDVVFVMDDSSSTKAIASGFVDKSLALFDSLKNISNIDLKVGVIKFKGKAFDTLPLTQYENNEDAIEEAIRFKLTDNDSRGTNVHGGLRMADQWLSSEADVDNNNKFVILLTDGKSYIWNNDEDEPTTIYCQYIGRSEAIVNSGYPTAGQASLYAVENSNRAYRYEDENETLKLYYFPVEKEGGTSNRNITSSAYRSLYSDSNSELSSVTDYDQHCYYADGNGEPYTAKGELSSDNTTNGTTVFPKTIHAAYRKNYIFTPDDSSFKWLEINPYEITKNDDGTYTINTNEKNPDYYPYHVNSLYKGTYKAGHLWADMLEKYNCGAILYKDGSAGSGISMAWSFMKWIEEETKYTADAIDSDSIGDMFAGIDNSIRYLVNSGTVKDKIAADFTLKESDAPFIIKVGGETLTVTKTGDHSWGFGEQLPVEGDGEAKYPYEISYDPDTKIITWVINVPVEIAHPVTLSYDLTLREDADPGVYDTNEYAVLDFESTDGEKGQFTFPIPQVTYKKSTPTPKPTTPPTNDFLMYFYKEWPDGEPTDIYFTLYRPDGTVYKHAFNKKTVSANKFRYEAWLSTDAEYFVIETAMPGYSTTYKNTGKYADVTDRCYKGGTIVNSKVPVTGDSFSPVLWTVTAAASLMGTAVLILKKRRA